MWDYMDGLLKQMPSVSMEFGNKAVRLEQPVVECIHFLITSSVAKKVFYPGFVLETLRVVRVGAIHFGTPVSCW